MRPRSFRLYCLSFVLMFASATIAPLGAESQTRRLPKAGFPVIGRPQGSGPDSLPSQMGVHLTVGEDRNRNNMDQPYNPGEPSLNMSLVRWEPKKMPLKIWISPGLKLPDVPFNEIQNTRVDMVFEMLRSSANPFLGVAQAPGWVEETNYQVAAGIEQWRQFESEGLFSFGFVEDPRDAHILVFYTDAFKDAAGPGGINVGGITSAQIYPLAQAQQIKIAQKPVIIELALSINHTPERLRASSAHEFGHALGIKAHSPYRDDIMYVDRVVDDLSPADKATIRKLYRSTPGYVM